MPDWNEEIRRQLADSAQRLNVILNDNWNSYLALPAEVYAGDQPPSVHAGAHGGRRGPL